MITLKIDDLLAGMPRNLANRVQQETHNVLLRWNSDLKQIYQFYSVVGTSSVDGMFTLSTKQFWRFIKDSCITDSVLTVARIDRTITEMRRRHANAVQNEVLKRAAGSMSPRSRRAKEAQLAVRAAVYGMVGRVPHLTPAGCRNDATENCPWGRCARP